MGICGVLGVTSRIPKKKTINFYLSLVLKLYNAIVTQYFVQRNRLNLNADAE